MKEKRLLDRVRDKIRSKHGSRRTERACTGSSALFIDESGITGFPFNRTDRRILEE